MLGKSPIFVIRNQFRKVFIGLLDELQFRGKVLQKTKQNVNSCWLATTENKNYVSFIPNYHLYFICNIVIRIRICRYVSNLTERDQIVSLVTLGR